MKNFKKIAGIMLALVMILAMAVPAFAAESATAPTTAPTTPSITITNAVEGASYDVYQMLTLESYNAEKGNYSYKVTDAWKSFVETVKINDTTNYFKVDANGIVTMNDGVTVDNDSPEAAALAKAALAYAKDPSNNIAATATLNKDNSYTAEVALGYYLVDSGAGTLCGLTTTKPTASVDDKNGTPTVDKKIEIYESNFADKNTAKIGDTVKFQTTITVAAGAEKYVLHDKMDKGLELKGDTITVDDTNAVYTSNTSPTDNDTFDIVFDDEYIKTLEAGATIVVTYEATLTKDAVVAGAGNVNDTYLSYGDGPKTTHSKTTTYTYSFDLVKTDKDKKVLSGAEFALYDAQTNGNKINLVFVKKEGDKNIYRVATAADNPESYAAVEVGQATITGLANGTYWLEETKQPTGYNKLTNRQSVTITDDNNNATVTDNKWVEGGVQVINYTGTELPSTGGIGTVIFYIVGGILIVGAGVILVVRKRMSTEKRSK